MLRSEADGPRVSKHEGGLSRNPRPSFERALRAPRDVFDRCLETTATRPISTRPHAEGRGGRASRLEVRGRPEPEPRPSFETALRAPQDEVVRCFETTANR